jgi:hypothetical protein
MRAEEAHRKVSHAAMRTLKPFWMSQKHTLDKLVLLPTPLTPTKVMLYGIRCCVEVSGDDNFARMENNKSVDVLGVNMCVIELDKACRTAAFVATDVNCGFE